ncbi:MAG: hypothetical protein HC877_05760 [Thioploca sp.]|nr:hypothetical protein [Thioploca sp.]
MSITQPNIYSCPIIAATPTNKAHFFGYHDLCPWNKQDNTLILLRTDPTVEERIPNGHDIAEICLWQPESDTLEPIAETKAWNWQQGARLQWLPNTHSSIIYNTIENNSINSVVLDLSTQTQKILPFSIAAISPSGQIALSPHFGRLGKYWPAYGYAGIESPYIDELAPAEDGLWQIDLVTGEVSLRFSLLEMLEQEMLTQLPNTVHFIAHPSFSPHGNHFAFMHRFMTPDGALYSRLFISDTNGSNYHLLAEEKVSHFDWYDDNTILVWTRFSGKSLTSIRRSHLLVNPLFMPIIRKLRQLAPRLKQSLFKEGYYLIDIHDPQNRQIVGMGLLEQDGHPMFSTDRQWIVTDTYPDKNHNQTLILFNQITNQRIDIGKFQAKEITNSDIKCDLHPRWNRANTRLCIDSTHNGIRQCLIIDPTMVLHQSYY